MRFVVVIQMALIATWWGRVCQFLITDDPYQFETETDDWLEKNLERYEIKTKWRSLSESETRMFQILKAEKNKRETIKNLLKATDQY